MLREEFLLGGPVMYALFGVWVIMFALILDRVLFWVARPFRRRGADLERITEEAEHNLWRIDALSQIATSLGLFGTVIGISQSFFARGAALKLAAAEVLASGLATALFTTVAGLAIFLCGQAALFMFHGFAEREIRRAKVRCG